METQTSISDYPDYDHDGTPEPTLRTDSTPLDDSEVNPTHPPMYLPTEDLRNYASDGTTYPTHKSEFLPPIFSASPDSQEFTFSHNEATTEYVPHIRRRRQAVTPTEKPEGGLAGGSKLAYQTLEKSKIVQDFWDFVYTTFLTMLYSEFLNPHKDPAQHTEADDRAVLYSSAVLGVARIRQVRVRSDSCSIHPQVSHMFTECYGYYSGDSEDKDEISSRSPAVMETSTSWIYSPNEILETLNYYGTFGTYGGGGFVLDLSLNGTISENRISELKDNHWVDRGTRAIIIDFTVFSSNVNLFVVCKIVVEFPPTGGIRPIGHFNSMKFLRYVSTEDMVVLGFEQVFVVLVVCYTVLVIRRISKLGVRFLKKGWNVWDSVVILLCYACIIMAFYRYFVVEYTVVDLMGKKEEHPPFDIPANVQSIFENMCAILLFFVWIGFLKYLNFNRSINDLSQTLVKSLPGIASFTLIFIIVFFAFAQLAYLVFGTEVEEYRTVWTSAMALLLAMIGKFNYKQLEDANFVIAPIFLILFVFFLFFILINIFGAIIFESYKAVRSEVHPKKDTIGRFLASAATKIFTCGRRKPSDPEEPIEVVNTAEKIRDALTRAGYTQTEIEIFFAKYEIKVDRDLTGHEAKRLKARLELRRFDFEPIDTSPQAIAELQRQVKRLKETLQQQQIDSEKLKQDVRHLNSQIE